MVYLPPELVDYVFCMLDLPEDVKALCACALVCVAWLPIARQHLYATLQISDPQPEKMRKLSRLQALLESSPGVGRSVRRLVVTGSFTGARLPLAELLAVLVRLPRLRHLHLHHWRISHLGSIVLPKFDPLVLETLELNSIGFFLDAPANIFRLLNLFKPTCELTLAKISFRYTYGARYADIAPTLPLPCALSPSSLVLHDADDRAQLLLEAFAAGTLPGTLTHLHVSFYDCTPLLPALARFLARCAVRRLTLDFARCFPHAFHSSKAGLVAARSEAARHLLPALRHTRLEALEIRAAPVAPAPGPFWDLCLDVLAALPPSVSAVRVCAVGGEASVRRVLQRVEGSVALEIRSLPEEGRSVSCCS